MKRNPQSKTRKDYVFKPSKQNATWKKPLIREKYCFLPEHDNPVGAKKSGGGGVTCEVGIGTVLFFIVVASDVTTTNPCV